MFVCQCTVCKDLPVGCSEESRLTTGIACEPLTTIEGPVATWQPMRSRLLFTMFHAFTAGWRHAREEVQVLRAYSHWAPACAYRLGLHLGSLADNGFGRAS